MLRLDAGFGERQHGYVRPKYAEPLAGVAPERRMRGLPTTTAILREAWIEAPPAEVPCELLAVTVSERTVTASFRATSRARSSVAYRGYSAGLPIYRCEFLEAGVWLEMPIGWCGTGVEEYVLEPGESVDFSVHMPADGRCYRFRFGDPPIRTPPVQAPHTGE